MTSFRRALVILALAVGLGFFLAALSLAFDCDLHKQASTVEIDGPLYSETFNADLATGDCWRLGGEPTGYPTRMWLLATDAYGSYYVDSTIQAEIDLTLERATSGKGLEVNHLKHVAKGTGADLGPYRYVTYTLAAFCDGVELPF